jgi:hypothetical protein
MAGIDWRDSEKAINEYRIKLEEMGVEIEEAD